MTIHRAILACVFFALGGCGVFGGSSYRYKMTVEVDTPQGVVTGSAVREITYTKGIRLPDASGVSSKQRGEARRWICPAGKCCSRCYRLMDM